MKRSTISRRGVLASTAFMALAIPAASGMARRPAEPYFPELDRKMLVYIAAEAAWLSEKDADGDITAEGPAYEAAWEANKAVLLHPCQSADEAAYKIKLVLNDGWLRDTVEASFPDGVGPLDFLRSLIPST